MINPTFIRMCVKFGIASTRKSKSKIFHR